MNTVLSRWLATVLLTSVAVVALGATFTKFTPATGILVGSATSSTTTAATSSNVTALWSGTCDSTTFLRGDGTCAAGGASFSKAFKSADTSRASTTTLADDPDLSFASVAAGTYRWDCYLYFRSASATPDAKFGMRISNAATISLYSYTEFEETAGISAASSVNATFATSPAAQTFALSVNANEAVVITGMVVVASSSTLAVQWAQNTSDATATLLKQGSWCVLTPLS